MPEQWKLVHSLQTVHYLQYKQCIKSSAPNSSIPSLCTLSPLPNECSLFINTALNITSLPLGMQNAVRRSLQTGHYPGLGDVKLSDQRPEKVTSDVAHWPSRIIRVRELHYKSPYYLCNFD